MNTSLTDVNNAESLEFVSPLPTSTKRISHGQNNKKDKIQINDSENSLSCENTDDNSSYSIPKLFTAINENNDDCKVQNTASTNFPNFITQRRVYFANDDEDTEDFTLLYTQKPRNMNFDINDLKLPVLEKPVIPAAVQIKEPEPEITATIQKIAETCPAPSLSNNGMDESTFNHSMVRLPLLLHNDQAKDVTTLKDKSIEVQKKKHKKSNLTDSIDFVECSPVSSTDNSKGTRKRSVNDKDPSAVKVVLQKLNEFNVKQRTPTPDDIYSPDNRQYSRSPVSSRLENSSDSEGSNTSTNSLYNSVIRPRRKRAPSNLQEPSLRTKLRRNKY